MRPPRTRLIAVAAASSEGGLSIAACPPPEATTSIHATEENSWNTCQKQASTPTMKTMPIVPLR